MDRTHANSQSLDDTEFALAPPFFTGKIAEFRRSEPVSQKKLPLRCRPLADKYRETVEM
jgi:hypothetical protein